MINTNDAKQWEMTTKEILLIKGHTMNKYPWFRIREQKEERKASLD